MSNRGRPVEPVPQDKADAIIEWVSLGKTLREWCRENNLHFSTVYDWIEKDEEFARRFARAREIGHDVIAEETMEIIDTFPMMAESENGGSRVDSGHVTWLRNRVDQRLKLLAKWNPKKYGDKVDVTSGGEKVGLAINIDLGKDEV